MAARAWRRGRAGSCLMDRALVLQDEWSPGDDSGDGYTNAVTATELHA